MADWLGGLGSSRTRAKREEGCGFGECVESEHEETLASVFGRGCLGSLLMRWRSVDGSQ